MSLMHFEPASGPSTAPVAPAAPAQVTTITATVEVAAKPSQARSYVGKPDATWEWVDLRDYVVHQIESLFGTFPRDFKKEAAIFKSFLTRHGDKAPAIARFAFEIEGGYWSGAPIGVNRFCKASDEWFADRIKARMLETPVAAW